MRVRRVAVGVGFLEVMLCAFDMPRLLLMLVLSALLHHPFDDFLGDSISQINKSQRLRPLIAHVLKDPFHPDIVLPAYIYEEVAVLDLLDVHWRGLVGMDFLARRQEHRDVRLRFVPCDRAGKIIRRKDRGDDPDPPVVLL